MTTIAKDDVIQRVWIRPGTGAARDRAPIDALLSDADVRAAGATLRALPEYRPTPLRSLRGAAQRAGVAEVRYKDESGRFGAGSFKAAGAAYAVERVLARRLEATGTPRAVVACATDGNHGRAVAWAARRAGAEAVVYLPAHAHAERERRIRALGATVRRAGATYDETVEIVKADAAANGWLLVSDTTDAAIDPVTLDVMAGYALIVDEILDEVGSQPPTHVFLQAGVGTMAAAVIAQLARRLGDAAPRFVVVEPAAAACVLAALEADAPRPILGSLVTVMDCLAAGRVSMAAWPILRSWSDGAIALADEACTATLALARAGELGEPLDVGPSGITGLAGLLEVARRDDLRQPLHLDRSARVLVIGTEEALT